MNAFTNILRKFGALIGALAFSATAIGMMKAPAMANPELFLPSGMPIQVQPLMSLGSLSHGAGKGATVNFSVKKDVIVDGWVAIPKGALVRGVITTSTTADPNAPQPATTAPTGTSGLLTTATTALNNATFAFEWVQLPAGKVRLDNSPQSLETALLEIGAGAFAVMNSVMGALKNQGGGGIGGGDMGIHASLEAHLAHGVHVPGLGPAADTSNADSGFIDR